MFLAPSFFQENSFHQWGTIISYRMVFLGRHAQSAQLWEALKNFSSEKPQAREIRI